MIFIGNFMMHLLIWFQVIQKRVGLKIGDYEEMVEFEPYIPSKRVCVQAGVSKFNYSAKWLINRNVLPALVDQYEIVVKWRDKVNTLCIVRNETTLELSTDENISFDFKCETNKLQIILKPQSLNELTVCTKIGQQYSCHATYKFYENKTQCHQPTLNFYNVSNRPYLRCSLTDDEQSGDITYRVFNVYNPNDVSHGGYVDISTNFDKYVENEACDWLCDVLIGNLTVGRARNSFYNTTTHSKNTEKYYLRRFLYYYLPVLCSCLFIFIISVLLLVSASKYNATKRFTADTKLNIYETNLPTSLTSMQVEETLKRWKLYKYDQLLPRLTLSKRKTNPTNLTRYKELCGDNYLIDSGNGEAQGIQNESSFHQHSLECISRKIENENIRFSCNYFKLTPIGMDCQNLLTSNKISTTFETTEHIELGLSYQDLDFELTPIKQQILWCTFMYENCTPMVYSPTSSSTSCTKLRFSEITDMIEDELPTNSSNDHCLNFYSTRGNLIVNNSLCFQNIFRLSYHINRYYEPTTEYTNLYDGVSLFQRQPLPHSIIWKGELIDTPIAVTTMFYYILSNYQSFENPPVVATTFVLIDQSGGFDLDRLKKKIILKKEEGNFGFSLVCNSKRLGNYIKDVVPGSVAEKAGIKPGDRVIQIGDINILGFQPIEIVKLLSNCENRLEMHVVEEKFYKVYLKQNEYPQISSPAYDEKNIDGSVFVRSSDEQLSTTSTAAATAAALNHAKMYNYEAAAIETAASTTGTTPNHETYRTLNTVSTKANYHKKDILFSAWIHIKSCFKGAKKSHPTGYSRSDTYSRNPAGRINFPTPKDEAVMTNTNVSISSTLSNEYGISNVRTHRTNANTKSSKNYPTTKSSPNINSKVTSGQPTQTSTSIDNLCDHNKQLAEKSFGASCQQNQKKGSDFPIIKKNSPPQSCSISKINTTKSSPVDNTNTKRNEVVIQFEHPKIIVLNSTERDIEV